jgi:hypothetical protein
VLSPPLKIGDPVAVSTFMPSLALRYVVALFDEGFVAVGDVTHHYEDEGRTWIRGHDMQSESYRALLAAEALMRDP